MSQISEFLAKILFLGLIGLLLFSRKKIAKRLKFHLDRVLRLNSGDGVTSVDGSLEGVGGDNGGDVGDEVDVELGGDAGQDVLAVWGGRAD